MKENYPILVFGIQEGADQVRIGRTFEGCW
jgi:hypothetical protein